MVQKNHLGVNKIMAEIIYKAIMVPDWLHQQIKVEATDKKMSIIELQTKLLELWRKQQKKQ